MAQGAKAWARDFAVLVEALQMEVILLRCPRAQGGCVHIVPVVPAFPVEVAMVAFEWECVVMDTHQGWAPDCSWVLEEQMDYIVAAMWAMAVADAAEG